MEYTEKQIKEFKKACAILKKLSDEGALFYCECDVLHLMSDFHHDENNQDRQERIVESVHIPGLDGGAW